MSRQIVLRQSMTNRRQPLLTKESSSLTTPGGSLRRNLQTSSSSTGGSNRFAEVAGGTAAECAAICCCCPCGIMNLLVLAVYKLPAGLCRKALKNQRIKRLKKNGVFQQQQQKRRCHCGCDETDIQIHPLSVVSNEWGDEDNKLTGDLISNKSGTIMLSVGKEIQDLEIEMWDRFYSTGFWRSSSQRDDLKDLPIISLD
ncbi:hypothetical protein MKW94_025989 [Papaver nudicaule]|uniref:Uncharacterized protein n=1 Tax=Papaver nudicaule TaxID=74823 RepID=A0AA41RSR3_PAPNU|nr:hypothetical protein [Papaver nudicaule]